MGHYDILIVGGGHGGAQAAIRLRQHGFSGSIAIVGDEPDLPYERPPLSKEYLSGAKSFERLLLRPPSFWPDRNIAMMLGARVTQVDATSKTVTTSTGEALGYGSLVWATGGRARQLDCPGHDLLGLHTIRTRSDIDRIQAELGQVTKVVVIGGGYIGLEAAAVLSKLGKKLVLLEAQDRVMARVAGVPLSRFYEAEHRAHGVDIRLGVQAACILGDGEVRGVQTAEGEVIDCQMVIVGIGIIPEVTPLHEAGAVGDNGVDVDAQCRTSLPDVFAIGDCARHTNDFAASARIRLESVQNANDHAAVVAKTLNGKEARYDAVPWFWSDQYDLKLQTIGISAGYEHAIVRGDPATRSFSVIYLKGGRVIALDCVNSAKDFALGRKLILQGAEIYPQQAADSSSDLSSLLLS